MLERGGDMTSRHQDIAAALQMVTEDVLTLMLNYLQKVTGLDSVVLAGGVALNSVYNGKILSRTTFKNVWVQPNASDGGSSMGAALYVWNSLLKNSRSYRLQSAYLGPNYSDAEIKAFLDAEGIAYEELPSLEKVSEKTAHLVFENHVVGWFQTGMEWGPRALGARSILSNATNKDMQAILNLKVKHREKFRPFAPVVCYEDAPTYFECDLPLSEAADYMLMVYPVRPEYRDKIPAVTHVDGSGRLSDRNTRKFTKFFEHPIIKRILMFSHGLKAA